MSTTGPSVDSVERSSGGASDAPPDAIVDVQPNTKVALTGHLRELKKAVPEDEKVSALEGVTGGGRKGTLKQERDSEKTRQVKTGLDSVLEDLESERETDEAISMLEDAGSPIDGADRKLKRDSEQARQVETGLERALDAQDAEREDDDSDSLLEAAGEPVDKIDRILRRASEEARQVKTGLERALDAQDAEREDDDSDSLLEAAGEPVDKIDRILRRASEEARQVKTGLERALDAQDAEREDDDSDSLLEAAGEPVDKIDRILRRASEEARQVKTGLEDAVGPLTADKEVDKRTPVGPNVTGPRMALGEEEEAEPMPSTLPDFPLPAPSRMVTGMGRPDIEPAPSGPLGDPTVPGQRMRGIKGDGRDRDIRTPSTMNSALNWPQVVPFHARRRPSKIVEESVPGLDIVAPVEREVHGRPSLEQAALRPGLGAMDAKVSRRLNFRYQGFEILVVHRPMLHGPVGVAPEPAAVPMYVAAGAPLGNGLVAQLVCARFGDHQTVDHWARLISRFGFRVGTPRLLDAMSAAGALAAPVLQALRDAVFAAPEQFDTVDLAARYVEGRRIREGRVRAVASGPAVWFTWRDAESVGSMATLGSGCVEQGQLAFDLLEDSAGRSRAGRWAQVRQKLHALLPMDPERAAYGLMHAHRVRQAVTIAPDWESVADALDRFRGWLDSRRREFDAPRSPFEHFVIGTLNEWSDLSWVDEAGAPAPPLHRLLSGRQSPVMTLDGRDGPPEDVLAWHSLIETCHREGIRPWEYLAAVLDAAGDGAISQPADWTPSTWRARVRRGRA